MSRSPPRNVTLNHVAEGRRGIIGLCLALVIASLLAVAQAHEGVEPADMVGFVLAISGEWLLQVEGKQPHTILKGQTLPVGGTVLAKSPGAQSSFITILQKNGEVITCWGGIPESCKQPLVPKHDSSVVSRIVEAVAKLFSHQHERYVSTLSRGEDLQEAVVKLDEGQVDLTSIFAHMRPGFYTLQFQRLTDDDDSGHGVWLDPIVLKWDAEKSHPIPISDLSPGLYEVSLPTGHAAWILVCRPGEYEKASASFQQAVGLTKQWGTEVKPNAVRSFIRAYLQALADKG